MAELRGTRIPIVIWGKSVLANKYIILTTTLQKFAVWLADEEHPA